MRNYRTQYHFFITLLIAIFILIGFLAVRYDSQIDITLNDRNVLHPTSEKIVKQLKNPLFITAFVRDNHKVAKALLRLLDKYRQYAEIKINLQHPDIALDLVKKYNITRDGELVIKYQGRQTHVKTLNEKEITKAIYRLLYPATKEIAFVLGHGERGLGNALSDYGALVKKLRDNYYIDRLDLNTITVIPEKITTLVIADAKIAYSQKEIKMIINYLQRGGRLLWLGETDSNKLSGLVSYLGIKMSSQILLNRFGRKYQFNNPDYIVVEPQSNLPLLKNINTMLLFPKVAPIDMLPTVASENWQALPFLNPIGDSFLRQRNTIKKAYKLTKFAVLLTSSNIEQGQKVIVIGDADFLSNQFIGFGQNMNFALNLFDYLSSINDNFIKISNVKSLQPVVISKKTMGYLAFIFIIVIPVLILILGMLVRIILQRYV